MTTLRSCRRKWTSRCLSHCADSKQFVHPITHGDRSSPLWCFAVRHENHSMAPVEVFRTDAVKLSAVPHSRVSITDDDVPKQLEHGGFPGKGFVADQHFLFSIIIPPYLSVRCRQ